MAVDLGAAIRELIDQADTGQYFGGRIYPQFRTQGAPLPACVYAVAGGQGFGTFDGSTTLANRRYVVSSIAKDYADANQGADIIRQALDGFQGSSLGVVIRSILFRSANDEYDAPIDGAARGAAYIHHDYDVFYVQS